MSIFFKNFGPYSKLRTANWPIAWRKQTQPYNNINYDARPARLSLVVMSPWFYQYQSCKWITEQYEFALFNSLTQVVFTPPQEDTSRQVTVESPPPPVSTSTAQSTVEGFCQREESSSDSEKEKPIWRPKLKRKRKKNNRQGWWLPLCSSTWLLNKIYEKNGLIEFFLAIRLGMV